MLRGMIASLGALLMGCSVFGIRSGYEAPDYEVVASLEGGVEVRRYGPRLAAQTVASGEDTDEAMDEAFRVLAAYIFARNREGEPVAMTVPVEVRGEPESIGMTVPVETQATEGGVVMRFFMPGRFTRETLPAPADPRVEIVEVPGETLAVLRFPGRGRAADVAEREAELLAALAGARWRPDGEPAALYYDPPWTLPFLRRNEVVVPVAPAPGDRPFEGPAPHSSIDPSIWSSMGLRRSVES